MALEEAGAFSKYSTSVLGSLGGGGGGVLLGYPKPMIATGIK